MRKKMLLLVLALAAVAGSLATTPVDAGTTVPCPQCVTYSDGSQCCVSCKCTSAGVIIWCTENFCPPEGGGN